MVELKKKLTLVTEEQNDENESSFHQSVAVVFADNDEVSEKFSTQVQAPPTGQLPIAKPAAPAFLTLNSDLAITEKVDGDSDDRMLLRENQNYESNSCVDDVDENYVSNLDNEEN